MNIQPKYHICLYIVVFTLITGCKKFVDIDTPPVTISQENIFDNDKTATTVLTGLFSSSMGSDMAVRGGLLADEFDLASDADIEFGTYYRNALIADPGAPGTGKEIWESYYNYIYRCNAAIEGISNSKNLSPAVSKQLLGEAYFMRAWFHFYLTNLYGDIPVATSTDPETNRQLTRTSKDSVYDFLVSDLKLAQEHLSKSFVDGQLNPYNSFAERVRPTYWAATAMLARVYLFMNDFVAAEAEATAVIDNNADFGLEPYTNVFLKNSREAIWQIQPTDLGWNTLEGRTFHLGAEPIGPNFSKPVYLSSFLLDDFEANDQRRLLWIDSVEVGGMIYYYPIKYREAVENPNINSVETLAEYSMMLRLAEQFLIRAEARAGQGNLAGAIDDIDIIRSRAALPLVADTNLGISQADLMELILHERRIELFTEWGHRWFDLKRTNHADTRMPAITSLKEARGKHQISFFLFLLMSCY
jgi:starch-binding outer membrane protein, SusD/RagB family